MIQCVRRKISYAYYTVKCYHIPWEFRDNSFSDVFNNTSIQQAVNLNGAVTGQYDRHHTLVDFKQAQLFCCLEQR